MTCTTTQLDLLYKQIKESSCTLIRMPSAKSQSLTVPSAEQEYACNEKECMLRIAIANVVENNYETRIGLKTYLTIFKQANPSSVLVFARVF